jgi:hypothetical protein
MYVTIKNVAQVNIRLITGVTDYINVGDMIMVYTLKI